MTTLTALLVFSFLFSLHVMSVVDCARCSGEERTIKATFMGHMALGKWKGD